MGMLDTIGGLIGAAAPYASTVLGMSGPTGALVNAGLGALGASMSSQGQAQQQYNYQLSLQHDSQAWQEKMWNMNNEYNSPANQVKRLQEGGLNANLAYGSLSGNVAQQASGAGTNSMSRYQTSSEIAAVQAQIANYAADLRLKSAEEQLKREQAETERKKQQNLQYDTYLKDFQKTEIGANIHYLYATHHDRVQAIAFQNGLTVAQTQKAIQDVVSSRIASAISEKMYELRKKYTLAQIMDLQSQMNYRATQLILQGELQQAQIKHWASQNLLFNSQRILNFANADLVDMQYNLGNQQWHFNQMRFPLEQQLLRRQVNFGKGFGITTPYGGFNYNF